MLISEILSGLFPDGLISKRFYFQVSLIVPGGIFWESLFPGGLTAGRFFSQRMAFSEIHFLLSKNYRNIIILCSSAAHQPRQYWITFW